MLGASGCQALCRSLGSNLGRKAVPRATAGQSGKRMKRKGSDLWWGAGGGGRRGEKTKTQEGWRVGEK